MDEELLNRRALYPRVSDIIGKQTESEMRKIPIDNLVRASIRGIHIHAYCTAHAKGLFMAEIEAEYQPYVNAFIEWCDENIKRVLLCKTRLYDDVKRFSGEPDMIVEMNNGRRALIDLKTTAAASKSWSVQLSAYDHLCRLNGYEYDDIFVMHLKKKYQKKREENCESLPLEVAAICLMQENVNESWDLFTSALNCYDYFHRKEEKL